MSLWRTADGQDWVLIPFSERERACVERVREAMQHALANCLEPGVALSVEVRQRLPRKWATEHNDYDFT